MRHINIDNAPKVWRTVGGGMRVRTICPDWLAQQMAIQAATVLPTRPLRSTVIINRICRAYGVLPSEVRGSSMNRHHTTARKACFYWLRRLTGASYPKIGRIMGGKDHTTGLHAVRTYPGVRAKAGRQLPSLLGADRQPIPR